LLPNFYLLNRKVFSLSWHWAALIALKDSKSIDQQIYTIGLVQ